MISWNASVSALIVAGNPNTEKCICIVENMVVQSVLMIFVILLSLIDKTIMTDMLEKQITTTMSLINTWRMTNYDDTKMAHTCCIK